MEYKSSTISPPKQDATLMISLNKLYPFSLLQVWHNSSGIGNSVRGARLANLQQLVEIEEGTALLAEKSVRKKKRIMGFLGKKSPYTSYFYRFIIKGKRNARNNSSEAKGICNSSSPLCRSEIGLSTRHCVSGVGEHHTRTMMTRQCGAL